MVEKGTAEMVDTFEAQIYVLKKSEGGRSKPLTNKYIQQAFSGIWSMNACVLLDKSTPLIMPGDTQTVKIWLRKPMVMKQGQRFAMREQQFTALTGKVTKFLPSHDEMLSGFNYTPLSAKSNMTEAAQKGKKKGR